MPTTKVTSEVDSSPNCFAKSDDNVACIVEGADGASDRGAQRQFWHSWSQLERRRKVRSNRHLFMRSTGQWNTISANVAHFVISGLEEGLQTSFRKPSSGSNPLRGDGETRMLSIRTGRISVSSRNSTVRVQQSFRSLKVIRKATWCVKSTTRLFLPTFRLTF